MPGRALSQVLVGRQEELSQLEDALLSANRGDGQFLLPTTNLAARLQTAAGGGEIHLSDEAFRRVTTWLDERGLTAEPEQLDLKGFEGRQPAYRLPGPVRAPA